MQYNEYNITYVKMSDKLLLSWIISILIEHFNWTQYEMKSISQELYRHIPRGAIKLLIFTNLGAVWFYQLRQLKW